jgi:hypothetical protein
VKERRHSEEQLAYIPADEARLLLATGRYIGEGFDDLIDQCLFMLDPGKFDAFNQAFEAPIQDNSALYKLMARKSPWE